MPSWSQTTIEAASLNSGGGDLSGGGGVYSLQTTLGQPGVIGFSASTTSDYEIAWGFQPAATGANSPPNRPTNILPRNGATNVGLTPTLRSSAFSDPNTTDTHWASQWQISATTDFGSSPPLVWDSGSRTIDLISIAVPAGVLGADTTYFWRARHQDNVGAWSPWSVPTYFQTAPNLNATIQGQVSDASNTSPIANALVTAVYGGLSPAQTHTDQKGNYSLQVMGDRLCTVTVTAAGYGSQQVSQIVPVSPPTTIDFALTSQAGAISGRVVDASTGNGIAGATMALSGASTVPTNPQGYYTISGVAPGYGYTVTASAAGYASKHVSNVAVSPGQTTVVNFSLTPAGSVTLRGHVRDAVTGTPIFLARVATLSGAYETRTNSTGFFSFVIPPGNYTIVASASGYDPAQVGPQDFAAGGTYTLPFELSLEANPPSPPQNLTAATGSQRVDLEWDANTELDLAGYNVYRDSLVTSPVNTALITGTHYQDLGLQNGRTYTYWVTAVDFNGNESAGSQPVQATPDADDYPEPVSGLRATLLPFGIVVLEWQPSPSIDTKYYHVYTDDATGVIDYGADASGSPVTSPTTIWVSQPLMVGFEYKFGIRVEDEDGNLETNTTVVISVTPVDEISGSAKVYIVTPKPGKRLRGNQVCVFAKPVPGFEAGLDQVRFEVYEGGAWRAMQTHNARHGNPDNRRPYFVLWDVRSLTDGTYDIRAVGIDVNGNEDAFPISIRVVVDNGGGGGGSAPLEAPMSASSYAIDIEEALTAQTLDQHQARLRVYRNVGNELVIGNDAKDQLTTLTIPAGVLDRDTKLRVTLLETTRFRAEHDLKWQMRLTGNRIVQAIDEFTQVVLESGQSQFTTPILMTVPYADVDNDGWVDGYAIRESELTAVLIDAQGNLSHPLYTSDSLENQFVVEIPRTGSVGIITKYAGMGHVAIASSVETPPPAKWSKLGAFLRSGKMVFQSDVSSQLRMLARTEGEAGATSGTFRWCDIVNTRGSMSWDWGAGILTYPSGTGNDAGAPFVLEGCSEFGLFFKVGQDGEPIAGTRGSLLTGDGEIFIVVNRLLKTRHYQGGTYEYEVDLTYPAEAENRANPAWLGVR